MSFSKNLQLVVASGLLLSLSSCGNNDNKSSRTKSVNPVCSELDCLSSINWKIQLEGKSYPDKARVDVNGTTVINECVSKQKYWIDRNSDPQNLMLENFYIPQRGQLKIDVIDMGNNCESETTYISDTDVEFEIIKGLADNELLIRL